MFTNTKWRRGLDLQPDCIGGLCSRIVERHGPSAAEDAFCMHRTPNMLISSVPSIIHAGLIMSAHLCPKPHTYIRCQSHTPPSHTPSQVLHQRLQLAKVRRAEPSDRIPAGLGAEAVRAARRVRAARDVVEARGQAAVDERVEEAERGLSERQPVVVQERDDARERRARARRALEALDLPADHDLEVDRLRGDVRVRAASLAAAFVSTRPPYDMRRLLEVRRVRGPERAQVLGHRRALVRRLRKVLAEATAREGDRDFGDPVRPADRGHVRAYGDASASCP
jgi:hypothetical protein